jgi:hypothetical protein
MAEHLFDSASRAFGAIICKIKKCGGVTLSVYKLLVESCVFSIIDYGSEVIGFHSHKTTEKLQLRILRTFLGLKKSVPTAGVKSEMRWMEPRSRAHVRMVRQFLRVRALPDTRITKRIYRSDLQHSQFSTIDCWSTDINSILTQNGLGHYINNHCNPKDIVRTLSSSLLSNDLKLYYESCLSFPKLRTYVNIVDFSKENVYLCKPLTLSQKSMLAKFPIGALPVRLETDRFYNIPVSQRICTNCERKEVESEIHMVLYCSRHCVLRQELYRKVGQPPDNLSDFEIIKVLVSDPNIVKIFAKYITECYDNRKEFVLC